MVFPGKIKRVDGPEDTAFMEGRGPADRSQLGPYPSAVTDPKDFKNSFISQKFNPDKSTFWQQVFSQETANLSQEKINRSSQTDEPNFPDPLNQLSRDFLAKYSGPGGAVERGLIEPDRAISRQSLSRFAQEPAASRINTKDQNTASDSKFAGAGGVKV
jgi:hypothetical protein